MSDKNDVYVRSHASIRVWGANLDPLVVINLLRLPYDHIHRSGGPRIRRRRDGTVHEYAPYRHGMWSMGSERWVNSNDLNAHLIWLLEELEPKAQQIQELIESGNSVDFFCFSEGYSASAPVIPKGTVDRAVALGIKIDIDHYEHDSDE